MSFSAEREEVSRGARTAILIPELAAASRSADRRDRDARMEEAEGLALAINASVPDWFYEGDAVYNETVHTQQGRGRIPFFLNQYKSLWKANINYSWMKLRNGSLKDYVPNHYPLGYLLVLHGTVFIAAITVASFVNRQDAIDHWHGAHEDL